MSSAAEHFFNDLLEKVIKPNAAAITEIISAGDIAIVFHALLPPGEQMARSMGWTGGAPVLKMTGAVRKQIIASTEQQGDPVTPRWLRGGRTGRIFVVSGPGGSLLVNFKQGEGYSIEPGSVDGN